MAARVPRQEARAAARAAANAASLAALETLVLGNADHPRFIQDIPVQADVWLAFAAAPLVDLLLVPTREETAGGTAKALRAAVKATRCSARIGQLPGIVAARVDFRTFLTVILPATRWWHEQRARPEARAWLTAVAALLDKRVAVPPADLAVIEAPSIGRIGLNRAFKPAATASCRTVKADAARLLFDIKADHVTWAVLDTGIAADHPAFRDHLAGPAGASRVVKTYDFVGLLDLLDRLETNRGGDKANADLIDRLKRNIVAEAGVAEAATLTDAELDRRARARRATLRKRLVQGRDLDWTLLEPFVTLAEPPPPSSDHGTQVAGIIAADWRCDVPGTDDPPGRVPMLGMCPDIRLLDIRVSGEGSGDGKRSTEFDVIAALQFIRFLNDRSEARKLSVHGANLSLSTPHDVRMYGCGSTLVCQECDRLTASGVVVVVAAGNGGYTEAAGGPGTYVGMSISDPGNAASVITVGATHALEPHRYGVSWFSGRGPTGDGRSKPDLVAPGERIAAPRRDTGVATEDTGTSFAAPHVSGAAALLIARNAELAGQPARVKTILTATATDLGRERAFQGAGLLDTLRALQSI